MLSGYRRPEPRAMKREAMLSKAFTQHTSDTPNRFDLQGRMLIRLKLLLESGLKKTGRDGLAITCAKLSGFYPLTPSHT